MIKSVIFDYGNVISMPQTGECYITMEQESGVPFHVFPNAFHKFRAEFDLGNISGAQLYSKILHDAGFIEKSKNHDLCKKLAKIDMDSWSFKNQHVVNWALELKKNGYKLGILSNMPYEFLDYYEKENPVFMNADEAVFSCRVKLIKPDPRIYAHTLLKLDILPHETVFFDDLRENIEAAKKIGMHGILFENYEQAKKEFEAISKTELVTQRFV